MGNKEITIDFKNHSFTMIYGKYINGYFIALPFWQVACDASDAYDTGYNQKKLYHALSSLGSQFTTGYLQELSRVLALAIRDIMTDCD